jgi:hypothetical protein
MKYIRVVLAVADEDLDEFDITLDEYIEGTYSIQGAYVSEPYASRAAACGQAWVGRTTS